MDPLFWLNLTGAAYLIIAGLCWVFFIEWILDTNVQLRSNVEQLQKTGKRRQVYNVLISPQLGVFRAAKLPLEIFSPLLEKCVGHSLKNVGPSQKILRLP